MSTADVCVIGAGVAGALVAYELGRAGRSVVLLDTGPRLEEADPERYERVRLGLDPWPWEDSDRDAFETDTPAIERLNRSRVKAVGGTTLHWNAYAPRLQPADFEQRARFGFGRDWPLTYDELEPWYVRAERALGVAGGDAPGAPPRSAPYPLPAHAYSFADNEFFVPAFRALGMTLGPNPMAVASQPYEGRSGCVGYATCAPMCPARAKYTAMVHVRAAEATGNVEVRAHSHVRRIRIAAHRRATHIEYVDADGRDASADARAFVIAAGAIDTPRLLLLSAAAGAHAHGLGNRSGMVGRNFMSHFNAAARARMPQPAGGHRIGFGTTVCWDLHDGSALPDAANLLLFPADLQGPTPAQIARDAGLWGDALKTHVRERYGYNVKVIAEGEMLPDAHNRVALSDTRTDRWGDPLPSVSLRLGAFEERSIRRGQDIGRRILETAGAQEIRTDSSVFLAHLIGTTVMGRNPEDSVCDATGRMHELDNVYIASSSLFPTSSASHPTLTIAALALRTADHLGRSL